MINRRADVLTTDHADSQSKGAILFFTLPGFPAFLLLARPVDLSFTALSPMKRTAMLTLVLILLGGVVFLISRAPQASGSAVVVQYVGMTNDSALGSSVESRSGSASLPGYKLRHAISSACYVIATGYGTERARQKLLVVAATGLVNTANPRKPAGLVAGGTQFAGERMNPRSIRSYCTKARLQSLNWDRSPNGELLTNTSGAA